MTSWRDTTSQQAQDDLDGLLEDALPLAQQLLEEHGAFHPYGRARSIDGDGALLAGWTGDEQPPAQEVLALLLDGARQQAADLRAVAFVADGRTDGGDAIRVELEHREGAAMAITLPYKRRRFGRGVEYGALRAGPADPRVW